LPTVPSLETSFSGSIVSQLSTHIAINAAYGRMFRHENGIIYLYVDNGLAIEDMPEARLLIVQGNNNNMTFSAQNIWEPLRV